MVRRAGKTPSILVFNVGSSSIKFSLFLTSSLTPQLRGSLNQEDNNLHFHIVNQKEEVIEDRFIETISSQERIHFLLSWIEENAQSLEITSVGHRVVHGGMEFIAPLKITEDSLEKLEKLIPLAPQHMPHNLATIKAVSQWNPGLIQVACFDTSFHATQDPLEKMYALPRSLTEQGIYRYGFHGLSYDYITSVLPEFLNLDVAKGRFIIAHLGSGASLCAVKNFKSISTTTGFSALDGLVMSTRCGAIDPGVLLYLFDQGISSTELSDILYNRSGLLGISEISGNMKTLLNSQAPRAREAIALFVHRLNQWIGYLAASLEGLDGLIFTGGIGENAPLIRQRVCEKAEWLGCKIDQEKNDKLTHPLISSSESRVPILVIPTNEEIIIARETKSAAVKN